MIYSEEQRRICVEVFEQTGYKIDDDDPVVIAGLFYSSRLKVAIEKHEKMVISLMQKVEADRFEYGRRIEMHFAKSRADLEEKISHVLQKHEDVLARSLAASTSSAAGERNAIEEKFSEMVLVAKQSALGEVPAIKRDIERFVAELKLTIAPSENGSFKITLRSFCASLTLSALASFLAAAIWFDKIDLDAWAYSDKPTVEQSHDAAPQAGNAATGRGKR